MRIKVLIIISVIFGWHYQNSLTCQTVYFNKTLDIEGHWGAGLSIISEDTSYLINAITGPGKKVTLISVDTYGSENWIKKYGQSDQSWYSGWQGSMKAIGIGSYILGGAIACTDTVRGLSMKFDFKGDSLWAKMYNSEFEEYLNLMSSCSIFNNGYAFSGEISPVSGYVDVILIKTDSLGNELWRTTQNFGGADKGYSILQTPDSGYIVGGYTYIPGVENSGDPLVVKFDKDGNYLWNKRFGGQYPDEEAMICLNEDSTFTVLTTFTDSMYTNEVGYSRVNLIKVSQDGEIIWDKKYCSPLLGFYISNIKKANDDGYICCGMRQWPDTAYDAGWLFRFNKNGDSLWFRDYMYYTQFPGNINQLYDVDITTDGGFIVTGQAFMAYPPNSLQKIWLLKVDSLGCDTAGCDTTVGVEEHEGMEAWGHGNIKVWPNPCREMLNVKGLMLNEGGKFELIIYDIFGRTVTARKISFPPVAGRVGDGDWQLDVSALQPGIYLAVVREGTTFIASAKFVVAR
ncbi:MAG: T9SS type A sorting domain-containing protein [Bacteroidales bacterium]|nr:T9SS type A sorting domain-containing protein [Bacteroidales bacterium]